MVTPRDDSRQTHDERDAAHEEAAAELFREGRFTDDAGFLSSAIRRAIDDARRKTSADDAGGRK